MAQSNFMGRLDTSLVRALTPEKSHRNGSRKEYEVDTEERIELRENIP